MKRPKTGSASAEKTAEASRDSINASPDAKKCGPNEFEPKTDLSGKTDSGPEPDVFGKEIPPQE